MGEFSDHTFSVTEISTTIKTMLEGTLSDVSVEGEISGLKKASSGHIYFDIKDEGALISVVLFKGYAMRADALKDGLKVLVRGDVSCYIKSGRYQIIARAVVAQTVGDLYAKFEALKQKLSEEGLFDEARKKELPARPNRIGIVTSPTGAALRDILSVLKRRVPHVEILIAPCLVQGAGAAQEIAAALNNLNKYSLQPDVILCGRGGGSMEDLWCFNEEVVARAIAKSKIPVISCVGHETDFTIADFVADMRAPTPSAAAELVAENNESTSVYIGTLLRRMVQSETLLIKDAQHRLTMALQNKFLRDPFTYLNEKSQEVDELEGALKKEFTLRVREAESKVDLLKHKLSALSPEGIIKRGFAVVRSAGALVRRTTDVKAGQQLEIQISDGKINAQAK